MLSYQPIEGFDLEAFIKTQRSILNEDSANNPSISPPSAENLSRFISLYEPYFSQEHFNIKKAKVGIFDKETVEDHIEISDELHMVLNRIGFYMGEALIRESRRLSWAMGSEETALKGLPVVRGFPNFLECPILNIAHVQFKAIACGARSTEVFHEKLLYWRSLPGA